MSSDEIVRAVESAEILQFPRKDKTPPEGGGELDRRLAGFPRTDLGNAERFAERYRGKLLHCEAMGWIAWDGKRWSRTFGSAYMRQAEHETVRAIQDEAAAIEGTDLDYEIDDGKGKKILLSEALRKHGRTSETRARLGALSERAACMLDVPVSRFDRDPMRFNVENGTLVFGRRPEGGYVDLRPHDPGDMITKLAPVVYDTGASCPEFDRFLEEVQPDAATRRFLAQWGGYSLTGDTSEQKLTFHYGHGRNGKGVWVTALRHVAGDYGDAIPIESFLDSGRARAGGQATPDLADLPGVRCLTTTEPEKGSKLAEGLIKQLTGGDQIKARHLNRDYFAFIPQLKLTITGNYKPQVTGTDEGIWNRLLLVPWAVYIPPERRDPHLSEKLGEEASGILNHFLAGLADWFQNGLVLPQSAVDATTAYREDSDPLGRFLAVCTELAIGERVISTEMHRVFCAWAKANGERQWTPTGFGRAMRERGVSSLKNSNVYWLDIRLTKGADAFNSAGTEQAAPDPYYEASRQYPYDEQEN
ncbi:DNA primase family protein [Methylocystis parvus]|uniref:DNA primase family protein n=1 Tax=Methylocystis parvus TaxID=134 RepID=UPI003C72685E